MTVGEHQLPHPNLQILPQGSGQNLDLLAQSLHEAGGVVQDHPTSSTSVLDSSGVIDDDMGLDPNRQLSPPVDEQDHRSPVYEDISPPLRNASVRQAPASSRDLHTPQHQDNSFSASSSSGSTNSNSSDSGSDHGAQKQSSSRDCFQKLANEAEITLPHLGEFQDYRVDPVATTTRVNALLTALSANLHELGQIGLSKSEVEEQYAKSVTALVSQREVVRRFRDRALGVYQSYEDTDDSLRELELNQLRLSISQLKATLASKDAEIKLLKEQLRRSTDSSFKSPKGKALVSSKSPYFKRSSIPSKDVMLASLQTPHRDYF